MMSRNALLLVVIASVALLGAGILAQETARPASGQDDTPRSSHGSKGGRSRITPEQEQELLDSIKDKRPELYEQAVGLKKTDPEKYRRILYMLQWSQRRLRGMPEDVRRRVQAEMDARLKVSRLLRGIRATDDEPKRKPLIKQLKVAVAEHFDAEQKGREGRLTMLEEQIKRLRTEMEQRAKDRDRIITDRVEHYLENPTNPSEGGSRHHTVHTRPVKDAPTKD